MVLKLRTVYPNGLNERIRDKYKKEDAHMLVGNTFPFLPRKPDRVSSETIPKNHNYLFPD